MCRLLGSEATDAAVSERIVAELGAGRSVPRGCLGRVAGGRAVRAGAPSGNGAVQRVEQLAATAPPDGTDAGLRLRVYVDGEPAALLGAVVGVLGARGAAVTVAVEKIVFGALRGLLASLAMVPIGFLVLDDVSWPGSGLVPAFLVVVLGAVLGGAMGLAVGTAVPARRINVLISVIFVPLIFTGSVQFPVRWTVLHRHALRALPVRDVVVRLRARAAVSARTDVRGRR